MKFTHTTFLYTFLLAVAVSHGVVSGNIMGGEGGLRERVSEEDPKSDAAEDVKTGVDFKKEDQAYWDRLLQEKVSVSMSLAMPSPPTMPEPTFEPTFQPTRGPTREPPPKPVK